MSHKKGNVKDGNDFLAYSTIFHNHKPFIKAYNQPFSAI